LRGHGLPDQGQVLWTKGAIGGFGEGLAHGGNLGGLGGVRNWWPHGGPDCNAANLPPLGEVPAKSGKGAGAGVGPLHRFAVPLPLRGRIEPC
jgi:hypothetical protein